jgi:Kef-type K+ transport system membrane component KefB
MLQATTTTADAGRLLVEGEEYGHADDADAGVDATRIAYEDLYASLVFVICVYVSGRAVRRILHMPPLVGEILAGVLLGPNLAGYVPHPISFVTLGEMGLILLLLEAGVNVDLTTLRLVGVRGLIVAIIGSMMPISIGFGISRALGVDLSGSIAAGACFGPTSAGIAMSTLKRACMLESAVGQLVICAAVIDDMIALVVLSQLNALVGYTSTASIVIPIASALAFLVFGGTIAVRVMPSLLDRYYFAYFDLENHGASGVALMFLFLIGMMPATYYARASYLMGAFLSGLSFCGREDVRIRYASQFKRLLQWLMRMFFAASIGFQVPIGDFGNGRVVGIGFLYALSFGGKFAVGFLAPNFHKCRRFGGAHLRDCLITGCSMVSGPRPVRA